MNKVLELKGKFNQAPNTGRPGAPMLPKGGRVSVSNIERLIRTLAVVQDYWNVGHRLFKPLVSIYYKGVVAKSNRMGVILAEGSVSPNTTIVGAKFSDESKPKHIITHCVNIRTFECGLEQLAKVLSILKDGFDSIITAEDMDVLNVNERKLKRNLTSEELQRKKQREKVIASHNLSKSLFCRLIKDAWYIDHFEVEERIFPISGSQIVTLYDTGLKWEEILQKLRMQDDSIRILDDVTWLVTPDQYNKIISEAPYLIAMAVSDFGRIDAFVDGGGSGPSSGFSIPEPMNEPVIGVIDTLFDQEAYFASWVDYRGMVSPELIEEDDYVHGTAVSSLLVDGPSLNPHLNDGCGRFRVRHFGVAKHSRNSTASLMEAIRTIVETNRDIKVWNLCLGSPLEIDPNFISPEATLLDKLQFENDIIFVVAGTNNRDRHTSNPRIGAPADSINSVVVNSVSLTGKPVEYSRKGPVLHFFNKPDVAVFGGDRQDGMVVYSSRGRVKELGTSFAAPWIARKLAYLIHVMGFSREVAKALLLDSAAGWDTTVTTRELVGFGIVPNRIEDVLHTPDREIKFVVQGVSEAYETYAYTIPVPMNKEQFPYVARATLCYFPKCSRSQGVDYTDSEMDIHFGRINKKNTLQSIDNNGQGDEEPQSLFEKDVRDRYRKWDNVKHISEGIKKRNLPRKRLSPSSPNWGINIKTKERLQAKSGHGVHFGVVITLREITGVNRIAEFMQLCRANNWFVSEVDIHARVETYAKAEVDVVFEEDRM
ncbi:MAG TPA: S8 family peptidase [Sphaerochaeta sp.]|nr:S8 family peptidase [Sphaerochaeta sp.]